MKNLPLLIFIGALIIGFTALSYFGVIKTQSIITPPIQAQVSDGRVLWIATIAGDSIKDGTGFVVDPANFVLDKTADGYPVGTKVVPKDDTIVYISKNGNYCEYVLQSDTIVKFGLPSLTYYKLLNPSRKIVLDVCVDGGCQSIDAVAGDKPLTFKSNGGELTVKGIGGLVGAKNCPEYSDVALVLDSKTNVPYYYEKTTLITKYNNLNIISLASFYDFLKNQKRADTFLTSFTSTPAINSGRNLLTGQMPDLSLGTGVVTIVADAKYFNSAYIVPSQQAKPKIDSITIVDIKEDSTGTAKIVLSNSGDTGTVSVTISGDRSQAQPSKLSLTLDNSETITSKIVAPSTSGADELTVKVCTTDQLGGNTCVEKSKAFNILQDNPKSYCGDGTCDANNGETVNTCSKDCKASSIDPEVTPPLDCTVYDKLGGLISYVPAVESSKGFLGLFPSEENTCKADYTGLFVVIGALIIAGLVLYFAKFKRK